MSRRRFYQNKKLDAIALICPKDFETNIQSYLAKEQMANIVEEFDNIQRSDKKYCYAVHNNIPKYWRYDADGSINVRKDINEHEFPDTDGIAIVSETLENGDVIKHEITLNLGTRSKYQFKENSTYRWVCICQKNLNGYIPMDTLWYFLGECNTTQVSEYYNNYSDDGSGSSSKTCYNTINYCHIRNDLTIIPATFLQYAANLKGGFTCPDSIVTIGSYAFQYSSLSFIKFGTDDKSKLKTIDAFAFANCSNISITNDNNENNFWLPIGVENVGIDALKASNYENLAHCNLRIPYTCKVFKGMGNTDAYGFIIDKLTISGTYYTLGGFGVRGTNYLKEIEIEDIGDLPNYYHLDKSGNCLYFDNREDTTITDSEKMKVLIASLGNANFSKTEYDIIEEGTTHLEMHCLASFRTRYHPTRDLRGRELKIPNSVKYIYHYALDADNYTCINPFKYNNNLISINIGNSKIEGEVDENGLLFLNLGKSLQSISNFIPNINYYIIDSENEYLSDYEGVLYNGNQTELISIPLLYKGKTGDGILTIPSTLKTFKGTNIQIPNIEKIHWLDDGGNYKINVTQTGGAIVSLFSNCSKLEEFITPTKLIAIYTGSIANTTINDKLSKFTFYKKAEINKRAITRFLSLKEIDVIDENKKIVSEPEPNVTHYFAKDNILYYHKNNEIYCKFVQITKNKIITLQEGCKYLGESTNVEMWLRYGGDFYNCILICPTTLTHLVRGYSSGTPLFKEIHLHSYNPPILFGDNQNANFTKVTASHTRFIHVPINALGHHNSQSTQGYNSVGCWCSTKNPNINYISDLYYDLILLQGTVINADGTPYVGEFTLTNDSAKSTILKKINVTTNEEGKYEVWCENLAYIESLNNSNNQIVNVNGSEPLSDTAHIINFDIHRQL